MQLSGCMSSSELFWRKLKMIRASALVNKAPEARQIIAHGETVGIVTKKHQAPAGAAENQQFEILSPHPGLDFIC
ncbi:MAG: hypothetical protein WDM76_02790 [Limisphaerales bacterium]